MMVKRVIEKIIKQHHQNGGPYWSREDGDIHAPHGSSTIDTIHVLGELGATVNEYPFLKEVVDFIFDYQTSDGSFKYAMRSSKLPCMAARILAGLGNIGVISDPRLKNSDQQLLDTQCSDGGWRCNTVRLGKSAQKDASNPGTTLYVLDAFRFRNNTLEEKKQLDLGVQFLLKHWQTKLPLGPCDFGIGSRFLKTEYPFLRYNIFYYVYVLSFYKKAIKEKRFKDAFQILKGKIENDKIRLENPHRAWRKFDFSRKGTDSLPANQRWKEIQINCEK